MTQPIVTFLSDFGLEDWFVGVVHGVLHDLCPGVRIVDLSHAVAPGDIERAGFVLEVAGPDFPPGTVHLAVVDPGVGTRRTALAVRSRGQIFVGPDNGLLEWALADPGAVAYALEDERYFRHPVSRTFHARDVFAPVAAHLARGLSIEQVGPRVADPVRRSRTPLRVTEHGIEGRIVFVDRFGNALSDIGDEALASTFQGVPEERIEVEIGGRRIRGIARAYGHAAIGTLVAIIGSSARLEIAQVNGDAATRFGIGVGDRVTVRLG
jgi:hypothetical protein